MGYILWCIPWTTGLVMGAIHGSPGDVIIFGLLVLMAPATWLDGRDRRDGGRSCP
jgi:hypothetical protein